MQAQNIHSLIVTTLYDNIMFGTETVRAQKGEYEMQRYAGKYEVHHMDTFIVET